MHIYTKITSPIPITEQKLSTGNMKKLGQYRTFYSKSGQIRTKKENLKKLGQIRIL